LLFTKNINEAIRAVITENKLSFWTQLQQRAHSSPGLANFFATDVTRPQTFSGNLGAIHVDFSKQRIDQDGLDFLLQRALELDLPGQIRAMFEGQLINASEQRAVLHGLLRTPERDVSALTQPSDLRAQAAAMRGAHAQMRRVCDAIHRSKASDIGLVQPTDIVNIGIGGSDLGPRLVTEALVHQHVANLRVHFITNVDAHISTRLLAGLNPATTLFIVASKTFSTHETRLNALLARAWVQRYLDNAGLPAQRLSAHFLAVSSNVKAAIEFGMAASNVLPMSDTVGGRYSVWSAVGLSAALAIGFKNFERFLAGARGADVSYQTQPMAENLTIKLALTEIWNRNGLGFATRAVVPYDDRLARLPEFLQQLEMESNGKCVSGLGDAIAYETCPVVWGGVGTNVQHAFFQAIHQGSQVVPVDFIGVVKPDHENLLHHHALLANMLAQAAALMRGKDLAQALSESPANMSAVQRVALAAQRVFPGNRPSTTFLLDRLTPESLGQLLAMLENKVHAQSVLWQINAFDQWGVELGKTLATQLLPALQNSVSAAADWDASTAALVARVRGVATTLL
jgi:glucose-6-phosphate isomerase